MFIGIVKFYSRETLIDADVITAQNTDEGKASLIEWYTPWLAAMDGRMAVLQEHVGDLGKRPVLTLENVHGEVRQK